VKKLKSILAENFLFDSHAHLSDGEELPDIINSAKKAGVKYICDMSIDWKDGETVLARANKYPIILPSIGIHPQKCISGTDIYSILNVFGELVKKNKDNLLMIGEIGLDYYMPTGKNLVNQSASLNKSGQKDIFEGALGLSVEFSLPVSVHIREAFTDAFSILKSIKNDDEIVILHSFTGSYEQLKKAVDNSWYIGVNGIITYKSAQNLRENLQKYLGKMSGLEPLDFYNKHIVFETDAPLLRPSNAVTKGNEPQNVVKVYEYVCGLLGI